RGRRLGRAVQCDGAVVQPDAGRPPAAGQTAELLPCPRRRQIHALRRRREHPRARQPTVRTAPAARRTLLQALGRRVDEIRQQRQGRVSRRL
ncbi:hypothetical protein LTR66_005364, partial [Elasticomyces elasticus]